MKPNFALGLTDDGITLWHRSGDGWLRVGAVALDSADIEQGMQGLTDKARLLAPEGITSKLVIPAEHLLLTQLHAPGPGLAAQSTQIRAALGGRTPFPVEELVFDWSGASADVAVVVTARETLIEAEDFATAHGLNPVCFVAALPAPGFRGEPFFGLTRRARAMGMTPDAVTRDPAVLRETGMARMPTPKAPVAKVEIPAPVAKPTTPEADAAPVAPASASGTETAEAPLPVAAPTPEPAPVQDRAAAAADQTAATAHASQAPATEIRAPQSEAKPSPEPSASAGFRTRRVPLPEPDALPNPKTAAPKPVDIPAQARDATKPPAPAIPDFGKIARAGLASGRAAVKAAGKAMRGVMAKPRPAELAPQESPDATLARLRAAAQGGSTVAAVSTIAKPAKAADLAAQPPQTKPKADAPSARLSPVDTLRKVQGQTIAPAATEAERMTVFGARAAALEPDTPRSRALLIAGGGLLVLVAAAIWALYFLARPSEQQVEAPVPALDSAAPIEAPVALPEDLAEQAGAPTDDLAAIEAALGADDAAEAERPIEDGSEGAVLAQPPAERAEAPVLALPDASAIAAPTDTGTAQTSADGAPALAETSRGGQIAELRSNSVELPDDLSPAFVAPVSPAPFGADPLPPIRGAEQPPAPATPESAAEGTIPLPEDTLPLAEQGLAIPVQTGTPPSRPPAKPERFSQPEAPSAEQDAALTQPTEGRDQANLPDAPASDQAAPRTEQGLVITVTQASPPITPPDFAPRTAQARDLALTDQAAAQRADLTQAVQQAIVPAALNFAALPQQDLPAQEQALQIAVVQASPAAVPPRRDAAQAAQPDTPAAVETVAAPQAESAQALPPPGGVLLSALLRPAPRPSDLARSAPEPAPLPDFSGATAQAVAASPRPADKPARLAQIVQRSLAAAQRAREAAPPASIAARVPEPIQTASAAAAALPNVRTATSVAREATQARAINLRQVNLLGVMGTNNNRRALVRLSNGRVVTVRVGEGLDGGQVTAIGDSELRYNRRGRDVVLRIAS